MLLFCYLFSDAFGHTMPQLVSFWKGVHPLKWVDHTQNLAVHPRKSLSSGSGLG